MWTEHCYEIGDLDSLVCTQDFIDDLSCSGCGRKVTYFLQTVDLYNYSDLECPDCNMKTYSLSERDCVNCNLTLTKTDKEKNERFFEIIEAYGIVAIDNSDEYSRAYYNELEVQYDEDEYYNFMETVGNFYMCCFKNVSDNNHLEICNQCENPSYRFNSALRYFEDINDLLYDDKVYNLTETNADCSECSKIGTTRCTNFLFWLRDFLDQKEQKVYLQIQRCSDYEHNSQTTSQTYDSYDYDSYAYIDYF